MYYTDKYITDSFRSANNPLLAEKDYLECMILDRLFDEPYVKSNFIFAGGGTITKIYHLGNRIGQDIDLALTNFNEDPANHSQLHRFRVKFTKFVFTDLNMKIQSTLKQIGDFSIITDRQLRAQNNIKTGCASPTLHVSYISDLNPQFVGCISIEFIPRHYNSDSIKHGFCKPYATNFEMNTDIPAVHYAQTFWDKVYALHTIHEIGVMRPGLAHHYYDVANLSTKVDLNKTQNMFTSIAKYQQQYTTRKLPPLTSITNVHLMPSVPDMKKLSVDYGNLTNRFIGTMEPWVRILVTINKINKNIKTL